MRPATTSLRLGTLMRMRTEWLNLTNLKKRAGLLGYKKIRRDGRGASGVSLDSWHGITAEAGCSFTCIAFWYSLNGNTVTVTRTGEPEAVYTLS